MSKSRGDRGKTPSGNQNAQSVIQNAIIPGKMMENEWFDLVDNESSEDFVFDIVREIADVACQKVFDNIIESRVQPYAVFSAKLLLLDIIQWQFMKNDSGETNINEDQSWLEDDEPMPCVTDSWAQGAVPVVPPKAYSPILEDVPEINGTKDVLTKPQLNQLSKSAIPAADDIENLDKNDNNNDIDSIDGQTNDTATAKDDYSPLSDIITDAENLPLNISPQPPSDVKSKTMKINRPKKFKPYGGSLPKFHLISLTPVTENRPKQQSYLTGNAQTPLLHSSESMLRTQHGRPPGLKEVTYDEKGNIIHVQRLNVDALPGNRVRTKFKIVDSAIEDEKKIRPKTKLRQKASMVENDIATSVKPITNSTAFLRRLYMHDPDVMNGLRTPLPPPMVDAIDVSEGVLIREGGLSKQGPRNKGLVEDSIDNYNLHPITPRSYTRMLDAKDIVIKRSTSIRSLNHSKPLPAISS